MPAAFTNSQAAQFAALVMYSWDMCDQDLHNLNPAPDPRIALDGWTVVGYVNGGDDIVKSGHGIRDCSIGVSHQISDLVCYGYVAKNQSNEYVVVIRGTDGAWEWADDFDFFYKTPGNPIQGLVECGFYSIFETLTYRPVGTATSLRLADGVAEATNGASVTVLGHSLGAAIAAYVTVDLIDRVKATNTRACLFACPRPGDHEFSKYFSSVVKNYNVFNYKQDLVPDVPPIGYSDLPEVTVLTTQPGGPSISADKACCHHLICYIALLDGDEFERVLALQGTTHDDCKCASCVTLPR